MPTFYSLFVNSPLFSSRINNSRSSSSCLKIVFEQCLTFYDFRSSDLFFYLLLGEQERWTRDLLFQHSSFLLLNPFWIITVVVVVPHYIKKKRRKEADQGIVLDAALKKRRVSVTYSACLKSGSRIIRDRFCAIKSRLPTVEKAGSGDGGGAI